MDQLFATGNHKQIHDDMLKIMKKYEYDDMFFIMDFLSTFRREEVDFDIFIETLSDYRGFEPFYILYLVNIALYYELIKEDREKDTLRITEKGYGLLIKPNQPDSSISP